MRNAELGINSIRISSAFRIPHSAFRKPVAWATNAITEGRARFRNGTQWFSRSGCWNRRAPARPCGRGKLAQFSLLQRFAVWWVAPPWPILSVAAVLLALCRLVDDKSCLTRSVERPLRRGRWGRSDLLQRAGEHGQDSFLNDQAALVILGVSCRVV